MNFDGDFFMLGFRGIYRFNKNTFDGVFDLVGNWSQLNNRNRLKRVSVLAARTVIGLGMIVPYFYPPLLIMTVPPYGYLSVVMALDLGVSVVLGLIKLIRHCLGYAQQTPVNTVDNPGWLEAVIEATLPPGALAATPTTIDSDDEELVTLTGGWTSEDSNIPGQAM